MVDVRPLAPADKAWAVRHLEEFWHSTLVARRGEVLDAAAFPGFVAVVDGARAGLLTYRIDGDAFEVLSISTELEGVGAGRALLDSAREEAVRRGCRRMWLVTTNNNFRAFSFYQRWGMDLVALHHDSLRALRRLKPEIPERDPAGVPIAHELEFELRLDRRD